MKKVEAPPPPSGKLLIYCFSLPIKSINLQRQQSNYFLVCKTKGGKRTNKPCKFPFIYNSKTYTTCTNVEEDFYWCSTDVYGGGGHVGGEWGKCDVGCSFGGIYMFIT